MSEHPAEFKWRNRGVLGREDSTGEDRDEVDPMTFRTDSTCRLDDSTSDAKRDGGADSDRNDSSSSRLVLERCRQFLLQQEQAGNLRSLKNIVSSSATEILIDGERLINFASNDYLGLSKHPELIERSKKCIDSFGAGSPSSRLIAGNLDLYRSIEERLARLKGTETAMIFPSGFQLNSTVLPALATSNTLFALDRLCHASLIAGATNPGVLSPPAQWFRFPHNDAETLEAQLGRRDAPLQERWIVTESVFSMDGDLCDLSGLYEVASSTRSCLYIDEAHATGVLGKKGMGLSLEFSNGESLLLAMGTFGKGLGSFGAYFACPALIKDYLINRCPGFIYSTALPPAVLGAIDAALDLIPAMNRERKNLAHMSQWLKDELKALGFETGESATQIIPVIVGDSALALDLSRHLEECGIFAPAIRPPTVPRYSARIRLSLSCAHTDEHLTKLRQALASWPSRHAALHDRTHARLKDGDHPDLRAAPLNHGRHASLRHLPLHDGGLAYPAHSSGSSNKAKVVNQFVLQHGWGFAHRDWQAWKDVLTERFEHFSTFTPDRGYFSNRTHSGFLEPHDTCWSRSKASEKVKTIIVAHSFGLHLLPGSFFADADLLVLIGCFLHFHPEDLQAERLSKRLIERMMKKLDNKAGEVINDFCLNCGVRHQPSAEETNSLDLSRLKQDLQLLNTNHFDKSKIRPGTPALILHGQDDSIVSPRKSEELHACLPDSKLIIFPKQGHALPFEEPRICIDAIRQHLEGS